MAKHNARFLFVLVPLWALGCETLNIGGPNQDGPIEVVALPNSIDLAVGASVVITFAVSGGGPNTVLDVTFRSLNPAVATVNQAGRVTCVSPGTTGISVTHVGGVASAAVAVRCTAAPSNLMNVTPGGTIAVQVNPDGTNEQVCTHQVANISDATITTIYTAGNAAIAASATGHTIPPGGSALVTFTYRGPQSLPLNVDATFVANGANGTRQETKVTYNITSR